MKTLSWGELSKVDPTYAQAYLAEFRSLPLTQETLPAFDQLERLLAERVHLLQEQGRIPDFDTLFNQACASLGYDPNTIRQS